MEILRSLEEEENQWRIKEREYQEQIIQALAFIKVNNLKNSYTNYVENNDFESMKTTYEGYSHTPSPQEKSEKPNTNRTVSTLTESTKHYH